MAERTERPASETRQTMANTPEHIRSRYTTDVSVPTISSEMIDNWSGAQGEGGNQQPQPTETPTGNQQAEKK